VKSFTYTEVAQSLRTPNVKSPSQTENEVRYGICCRIVYTGGHYRICYGIRCEIRYELADTVNISGFAANSSFDGF
jgi:hypothetical protein